MFQCALFGMTNEKFEWNSDKFTRTEKVYRNKQRVAVVIVDSQLKTVFPVIFYDLPDKNKQRISVVSKIVKTEIENYESFLNMLGYLPIKTNQISGFRYQRSGYIIELSKFYKKHNLDSSEEEEGRDDSSNIPSLMYDKYLVKVFVETEDVTFGEIILQKATIDLVEIVKLQKPNLSLF